MSLSYQGKEATEGCDRECEKRSWAKATSSIYRVSHSEMVIYRLRKKGQSN